MGYTVNSIEINLPAEQVFSATNNPDNWTELMGYHKVSVLDKTIMSDGKMLLRFSIENIEHEDGKDVLEKWTSHRIIDQKSLCARGVREDPQFPFVWWILDIHYEPRGKERTLMSWTQDFHMDPKTGHSDEEIEGYINKGSKEELMRIKQILETKKY